MTSGSGARLGTLALVAASILWGTTGTAASFMPESVSSFAIGASTFGVGGVLLFAFSARAAVASVRDSTSRRWVVTGAAGVVVYPLAFYFSMDAAGVAIGNVVSLGSGPVFAAIFDWLWSGRRPSARWAACAALAVGGVILLSTGRTEGQSSTVPIGVLCGLLAGLAYALYTYSSGRAIDAGHSSRGVMGAMFGLGAAALAPVLVVLGSELLQSTTSIAIAAYLALVPMFVAYLLFGFGLRGISAAVVTTVTLIEPAIAALLATVVIGERLLPSGWAGLAIILLAVTLLVSARQSSKPSSAA